MVTHEAEPHIIFPHQYIAIHQYNAPIDSPIHQNTPIHLPTPLSLPRVTSAKLAQGQTLHPAVPEMLLGQIR